MTDLDPIIGFPRDPVIVAFAGDWHMNTHYASRAIEYANEQDAEVIVHLGDYGYSFDRNFLDAQQDLLEKFGMVLMFIDGNHEDHDWLDAQPIDSDGVRRLTSRIWHLPRGFRWNWYGLDYLALGGAYSIDRAYRELGSSWWEQETLTDEQAEKAIADGPAHVMVVHDAPITSHIQKLQADWLSPAVLARSQAHREKLQEVVDKVKPSWLWHGHFHQFYQEDIEGPDGDITTVTGLDCDGAALEKNVDIVDVVYLATG